MTIEQIFNQYGVSIDGVDYYPSFSYATREKRNTIVGKETLINEDYVEVETDVYGEVDFYTDVVIFKTGQEVYNELFKLKTLENDTEINTMAIMEIYELLLTESGE